MFYYPQFDESKIVKRVYPIYEGYAVADYISMSNRKYAMAKDIDNPQLDMVNSDYDLIANYLNTH